MKVKEIVTPEVICVEVPSTRSDVLASMEKTGHYGFPVVKKGTKQLVGIVTKRDLLKNPDENQTALLMTRNSVTLGPEEDVKKAITIMVEKNIRRLPVIQGEDVVGIVTVADIIHKAIARLEVNDPVKPYVKRVLPAIWEKTPLKVAYELMRLAEARSMPVLNDEGRLSGIVTDEDLINVGDVSFKDKPADIKASSESEWDWDSVAVLMIGKGELTFPNSTVGEVMTKEVVSVTELTPISECARRMRKNNLDQLPVLNAQGNLVGMVYDVALLAAAQKYVL